MSLWDEISKKISFHAVYDNSILDALYFAKEKGFAGIQVAVEIPHLSFENISDKQCSKIREICEKDNLYLSIHGPDVITSLLTTNDHLKQGIFSYYKELFTFAEKINSKLITIHLGNITRFPTDTDPEIELPEEDLVIYKKTFNNNLRSLLELANKQFFICIENDRSNSIILDVVQPYLKKEEVWLCWDLAKKYDSSFNRDEKIEKFFLNNINSIKQIHLHDLTSNGKSHKVISSGLLDFKYFLNKLKIEEIMDFCLEVRPHEKAYESLLNLKRLLTSNN